MNVSKPLATFFLILLSIFVFLPRPGCLNGAAWADEIDPRFKPIVERLIKSGFKRDFVEDVFRLSCNRLDHKVLILRLTIRESKLDYDQFLEAEKIQMCRDFLQTNFKAFQAAWQETDVPPEVLVGLLLLETKLGTYLGKYPTLRTLATHAAADQIDVAQEVYERLPDSDKKRWTVQTARKRIGNRTKWSYGELKAFLKHIQKNRLDSCQISGSYTGAIGLCQFQPSNIPIFGRDGNGDGVVDLFTPADAIMSAANYLKRSGWKSGISEGKKQAVLMRYNNSRRYAQTILEIARRVSK